MEITRNEIFQSFSNSLGSWWIELDEEHNLIWANKKCLKALDYLGDELGFPFKDIYHKIDLKKFTTSVGKATETGKIVPFVAKVKDKSRQYHNVKFKVKYSKSNKTYYIVAKEFKRRFDLKLQLEQYSKNLFAVNQSLEKTSFGLMRLQGVMSTNFDSFEEQIQALLDFGCKSFGVTSGTISTVSSYGYKVKYKIAPNNEPFKDVYNLKDTFCFESYTKRKTVTSSSVPQESKYNQILIGKEIGCVSFISCPLIIQEEVLGTLCFYSNSELVLENNELHFLSILASMVARSISLDRAEKALIASNDKLEEKNAELDKFAFTVSHDLKAPLRAVKALVEWIGEDLEDKLEDEIKENFDMLTGRVSKMEQLIYDILEYSRAGNDEVSSEQISLSEMINDVCDENESFPERKITFEKSFDNIQLVNKRVFLYQTLSNLVSNACKYNDKDEALIKISAEEIGGLIKITVADNGPGIPKEYREKVFQVFQTVHKKRREDSTGIGLSIVQKIVKAMGGRVYVEDSELGGSAFVFTLLKNKP